MQPANVTPGRIAVMAAFAVSCFCLLLFLWISFGGTTPLKSKGYRFQIAFPEAQALAIQSDVRIAGVSVGKVIKLSKRPDAGRELATIQLRPAVVPLPSDAKAILRTKTLLGETFVELTPGTATARPIPDGGRLADGRVAHTVEIDEILNTFDPKTRKAFKTFNRETSKALDGQGPALNDALGNLPTFVESGGDLLQTLDTNRAALRRLVRNTGVVFSALNQSHSHLQRLVTSTDTVFATTAARATSLEQTIAALPAFLKESRRTFARTKTFAQNTRAVVRLLRRPTRDLAPTVRDLGTLAPDLQRAFVGTQKLEPATRTGLPATSQILRGIRPTFEQLDVLLSQLNPILQYLQQNQTNFGDFFTEGASAFRDTLPTDQPGSAGHYLRQFGVTGVESVGIFRNRVAQDRGDSYPSGEPLADPKLAEFAVPASFDCRNAGGERKRDEANSIPGCWVARKVSFQNTLTQYPQLKPADYSKTAAQRGR